MKTAICTFCAQTGMFCKDCQSKINKGEVTKTEVEIAKIAAQFEKLHQTASKVTILETIERPGFILLLVKPGDSKLLIGGSLDFDKRIEKVLRKPVKIMEKSKNRKKVLDDIFAPAIISGINTVFVPIRNPKPGQSSIVEESIVVLAPSEKDKLPGTIGELNEIIKKLLDEEVRVEFR
ncbi:MAG: hypothetical protein ACFFDW_10745 [Candidatus Thorarchaeota archaeon]